MFVMVFFIDFNFFIVMVSLICLFVYVCVYLMVDEVCMSEFVIKLRGILVGI